MLWGIIFISQRKFIENSFIEYTFNECLQFSQINFYVRKMIFQEL